jgi:hypothetical protein
MEFDKELSKKTKDEDSDDPNDDDDMLSDDDDDEGDYEESEEEEEESSPKKGDQQTKFITVTFKLLRRKEIHTRVEVPTTLLLASDTVYAWMCFLRIYFEWGNA